MKIGRNDPCPCGSGKKHKRCCLGQDEQRASQELANEGKGALGLPRCDCCSHEMHGHGYVDLALADELDALTNRVPDLIEAGRLDEAEAVGFDLLNRFPDQIDGMERLAEVYEARGDAEKAVEYYRKAAVFATLNLGFDAEAAAWYASEARRLERHVKS